MRSSENTVELTMLSEFDRRLDDTERARLIASLRSPLAAKGPTFSAVLGAPGLSPIGAVALLLPGFVIVAVFWSLLIAALSAVIYLLFISLPIYLKGKFRQRAEIRANKQKHNRLKDVLQATQTVRVQRVESNRVALVIFGDVVVYLFDLGDGRMFWHGLESGEAIDPQLWPNSCFEFIRAPDCDELFGPFCEGIKLELSDELDGIDGIDLDLSDSGIINRSLNDFLADVRSRKQLLRNG